MVSRFDSPVNVQIEGDGEGYLPQGLQLMDVLMKRRTISGLTMMKQVIPLDDGAYAYAISAGGVNVLRIVVPPKIAPQPDEPGLETLYPDFYSGVVFNGVETELSTDPDTKVLSSFQPTQDCARLFALQPTPQAVVKLDVQVYTAFDELQSPEDSPLVYTQYEKLKPTMYSGTMRQCVQLLMGFGKQSDKSIYDTLAVPAQDPTDDPSDDPTIVTPPPSTYENEVKKDGRQIRYDYRFAKTQGLTKATNDGAWWLVEISMARGMIAMPLPINDATRTDKFRDMVTTMSDPAGVAALDLFGGYPTGDTFPEFPEEFDAWVRAGRTIRLAEAADVAAFYANTFYSSAMGWCFNINGTEAHNTAYNFDNPDGVQRGVHYACNLSISTAAPITPDPRASGLKTAFGDKTDNAAIYFANMAKLDRLDADTINGLVEALTTSGVDATYDTLNALQAPPMGAGSGTCKQMDEGKIYWPTAQGQPQIKFAEPLLGYLVSQDMRPSKNLEGALVVCDTIMFVMYQGDELKVCKLYNDPTRADTRKSGDTDFDVDYNPVGSFSQLFETGPLGVPPMFYTTDYDDRADIGTQRQLNTYVRRDHGWCAVVGAAGGFLAPIGFVNNSGPLNPGFNLGGADENNKLIISKFKYFSYETWETERGGLALDGAVAIPFFDRCAYYYARLTGDAGGFDSYSYGTGFMASPYLGHWFRDNGEQGSNGAKLQPETQVLTDDGSVWPTFWGIADEGDWVPHGIPHEAAIYGSIPDHSSFTQTTVVGAKTLEVFLVGTPALGTVPTWKETRTGEDADFWEPFWFTPSPDPDTTLVAYIQTNANALGPSDCTIADVDMNESHQTAGPGRLIFGSPRYAELLSGVDTFVGVV